MKSLEQSVDEARAVAMLRALANPARFRIVQILAARNACVCGELVGDLPLAQSTVSEHLKVLKASGLIQGAIEGPNSCYCLDPDSLQFLSNIVGTLQRRKCC